MRRDEMKRLIRRASKLQHFGSAISPGSSSSTSTAHQQMQTNDGESLQLDCLWGTRLDQADSSWAFELFRRNMREYYLKSQWGYDEMGKQHEMTATASRYLILRNSTKRPVAFVHFRFTEDEGRAVLYCYDIQVEPDYQQKGLGSLMVGCLDRLAKNTQMELLMSTVFAFNGPSLAFFHKLGFRADSSCRFGKDGRDFCILSKRPGPELVGETDKSAEAGPSGSSGKVHRGQGVPE